MKKTLAVLLTLIMVFALIPATFAEGADYTLVIKGGETISNMETVDETDCLKVDVFLNGAVENELVFSASFDLNYNTNQLELVKYTTGSLFGMTTVNEKTAGLIRLAAVSTEGVTPGEDALVLTLYFKLAENLQEGDEIAFTVAEGAYVENSVVKPVIKKDLGADLKPFVVTAVKPFDGVVKFNEGEVQYKIETPYVIWDHAAGIHEPAFTVYEADGETVIDPENYDFEYKENKAPGTGYLFITFKNRYSGEAQLFFKIYLPATTKTYVENVAEGIKVTWAPVEDAAGYVIYRRAWSTTTNGWTDFTRWYNTTDTTWTDGTDDDHKVYAGTRYQYGVKAYFAKRTDPVSGATIGGNVGDNYNLGVVGPLKTTVRITTRKLLAVEAGTKQMTVKWERSKNFTGYQIQYATDANFKQNAVAIKIEDPASETVIENLTSGTTYYVRVRSYHIFEGMNYFGQWSNVIECTVE